MRARITEEQKTKIVQLRETGLGYREIGEAVGVNIWVAQYWGNPAAREKAKERFKKHSKQWRKRMMADEEAHKKYLEKYRPYIRKYMRERYQNDEKFRENAKRRSREYKLRKKRDDNNEQ